MIFTLQSTSVSSRKSYLAALQPNIVFSMSKTLFILIAYLTCCIWAWPAAPEYRRTYNDFQPMEASEPDIQPFNYNQWDLAQEPMTYDQSDDYYQAPLNEVEALSNLIEMYDSNAPVWGQIVNAKPESELEELKAEERQREAEERQKLVAERQRQQQYENNYKYYPYDRQEKRDNLRQRNIQQKPSVSSSVHQHHGGNVVPELAATVASVVSSTTSKSAAPSTRASSVADHVQAKGPSGQKEVPLLRPPNKGKTMNIHEPDEPVITVAQRSSAVEKPSAYDTLRKYLTLEDALKKEAEKRRAPSSRVHKRTPNVGKNQIVSDVDSLKGQLRNLKKSVV